MKVWLICFAYKTLVLCIKKQYICIWYIHTCVYRVIYRYRYTYLCVYEGKLHSCPYLNVHLYTCVKFLYAAFQTGEMSWFSHLCVSISESFFHHVLPPLCLDLFDPLIEDFFYIKKAIRKLLKHLLISCRIIFKELNKVVLYRFLFRSPVAALLQWLLSLSCQKLLWFTRAQENIFSFKHFKRQPFNVKYSMFKN